ncbi:MAG: hypothetical protein KatS3mg057_1692 [Herpetosiphonaceae bacterium]|nr:MAG: hypothetical protein KatS3mg057_1692 [Herpetosiphonaceae bacterium]
MDAEVAHRPGEDPRTCEAYTPMGYPLHPFTAHFPIALLLTASALELLALRRGDGGQQIVQLLLRIGWWAALITPRHWNNRPGAAAWASAGGARLGSTPTSPPAWASSSSMDA